MFSRILLSTFAVASVAVAAPALADEDVVAAAATLGTERCDVQRCCGGMMERRGKAAHHEATEREKATAPSEHERSQAAAEDDPFVRNQSWGG